jgi:hypothetical protein
VIPFGFEPKTYRLEICCSIQLSYGTIAAKIQKSAKNENGILQVIVEKCPIVPD